MTILLHFSCYRVKYCIDFFNHGIASTLIVGVRIGLVISCAGTHWLAMRICMLLSWVFLRSVEDFFICATISGRDGVGNLFGVITLGGVAVISGTGFIIVVSLYCITLGDIALGVMTLLVVSVVTCTVG